ncbi:hypothetical protein B0H13DRAFT_2430847 [Mycena leptocephala]|nr:hypothetical protein B0H13DRAFT_2430847 [Mycena leptocephala]
MCLQAFTDALTNPHHDPFFSVENAPLWITSLGFQLYALHDDSVIHTTHWTPDDASTRELKAYRSYILPENYQNHPFFGLEDPDAWINPVAFQAYMATHAEPRNIDRESASVSSRAPSRASSSVSMAFSRASRASSRASFFPSSRASSPVSNAASDILSFAPSSRASSPVSRRGSRPASAMSVIEIMDSDSENDAEPNTESVPSVAAVIPKVEDLSSVQPLTHLSANSNTAKGKGKAKKSAQIVITRQLKVDEIVHCTSVPSTFDVPRKPTAILIDLSGSSHLLVTPEGKFMPVDKFIRGENQESWDGSGGHAKGDVGVRGFFPDVEKEVWCRRATLKCNGIDKCEYLDPTLFAGLERYEADEEAMRELWNHELDQNEAEAASPFGVIARFFTRIQNSKCKVECDGVPILVPLTHATSFCIREKIFHWLLEVEEIGKGLSSLLAHAAKYQRRNTAVCNAKSRSFADRTNDPKSSLCSHCSSSGGPETLSHIIDGKIMPAEMERRECGSRMIIHIPVEQSPATLHKALVVLRDPHNHPMHPRTKPTTEDKIKLGAAVKATGLNGLTVQKLLNGESPSTSSVYDGGRVAESSPAFVDNRKVRDFIIAQKKLEHPNGLGWEGVLYHLSTREVKLLPSERYIHTAMSKNGFRLVVTMHPQIAKLIHNILALVIDYTFKRVEGKMDEWEVAGIVDRFKKRYTLGSLYCDTKNTEAFAQLFTEFFDTIQHITGQRLKIAPFYPDAKCRVVILDGEVPQGLGFGRFLATYNNPEISQIWTSDPIKLLAYCLKTCSIHFERHIDELPQDVPKSVIAQLKSIMAIETQSEIDKWRESCVELGQKHEAIKTRKPVGPSVNKFLSNIAPGDWDITPNHSNTVESAHAARNAETGTRMPLLTAILKSQESDNAKARELVLFQREAVIPKRWNGSAEREKLAAQRKKWAGNKAAELKDQLTSHDTLKAEREAVLDEIRASLERQKILDSQIKSLQDEMKIDRHRSDHREEVVSLRKEVDEEKSLRRELNLHRGELTKELEALRKSGLAGFASTAGDLNVLRVMVPLSLLLQLMNQRYKTIIPMLNLITRLRVPLMILPTMPMVCASTSQITLKYSPDIVTDTSTLSSNSVTIHPTELSALFPHTVSDLYSIPVGLRDHPSESEMEPNGSFDPNLAGLDSHLFDEFLVSLNSDPYPLSFSDTGNAPIAEEQSEDYNCLEYIGPPTDYDTHSAPSDSALRNEFLQATVGSTGEHPILHSTGLRLSQELPRLPAPPSSPTHTESEDLTVNDMDLDYEGEVAPRDINLSLDENNIVPGKRRRTVSSRAAEGEVARSKKRSLFERILPVAETFSRKSMVWAPATNTLILLSPVDFDIRQSRSTSISSVNLQEISLPRHLIAVYPLRGSLGLLTISRVLFSFRFATSWTLVQASRFAKATSTKKTPATPIFLRAKGKNKCPKKSLIDP